MAKSQLCRLCALNKDNLLLIYGEEGLKLSLEKKIVNCLNLQLSEKTYLPNAICIECCSKLDAFDQFLEETRNAQSTLGILFSEDDSNKEEICEVREEQTINSEHTLCKEPFINKCIEDKIPLQDALNDSSPHASDEFDKTEPSFQKANANERTVEECDDNQEIGWNPETWLCCDCSEELTSVEELRNHHKFQHKQDTKYMCLYCSKLFILYAAFIAHLKRHRNSIKYNCLECGKGFSNKKVLDAHSSTHSDARPYACQECGKSFRQQSALYIHSRCHLPDDIKNKFPCNLCNKRFSTKPNLVTHMRIHTGVKNYTCDQCGKSFIQKGNLDAHLLTHSHDKPFSCELCCKRFKTGMQLRKHHSVHTGAKPHQCDVCGRTFREKGTLREHHRIHTGAMPFTCEFCGKAFRFKGILTTHRRQHTGERPYSCLECQHHFTNWPNYNKHMKRRHGINTSRTSRLSGDYQISSGQAYQEIQTSPDIYQAQQTLSPYMYNVYSLSQVPVDPLSL